MKITRRKDVFKDLKKANYIFSIFLFFFKKHYNLVRKKIKSLEISEIGIYANIRKGTNILFEFIELRGHR